MKKFTVLLVASVAAAFASQATAGTWRIEPGAIKKLGVGNVPPEQRNIVEPITATFTLRRDPNGHASKRGGACLVMQPSAYPRTCAANAECMPGGAGTSAIPAGWYGYCVGEAAAGAKQCWYRPGSSPAYCKKSAGDLVVNQAYALPIVGAMSFQPAFPAGPDRSARWRVITCQNLVGTGCNVATAVEGTDKKTRYGTPKKFAP